MTLCSSKVTAVNVICHKSTKPLQSDPSKSFTLAQYKVPCWKPILTLKKRCEKSFQSRHTEAAVVFEVLRLCKAFRAFSRAPTAWSRLLPQLILTAEEERRRLGISRKAPGTVQMTVWPIVLAAAAGICHIRGFVWQDTSPESFASMRQRLIFTCEFSGKAHFGHCAGLSSLLKVHNVSCL